MERVMPTPLVGERLQVGAPDPELETSPILGDEEEFEVDPKCRLAPAFSTAWPVASATAS
jgi:hypothetical protein